MSRLVCLYLSNLPAEIGDKVHGHPVPLCLSLPRHKERPCCVGISPRRVYRRPPNPVGCPLRCLLRFSHAALLLPPPLSSALGVLLRVVDFFCFFGRRSLAAGSFALPPLFARIFSRVCRAFCNIVLTLSGYRMTYDICLHRRSWACSGRLYVPVGQLAPPGAAALVCLFPRLLHGVCKVGPHAHGPFGIRSDRPPPPPGTCKFCTPGL